jgi:Holliday junction resolvasome RuvABC endonuclease subunit
MAARAIRILGLDPGLQHTGWGLIESDGYRLRFVAEGVISTSARDALGDRLLILHQGLAQAFANLQPDEAAAKKVTEASSFFDFKARLTIASQRKNMVKKSEFDVEALIASFRAFTMF